MAGAVFWVGADGNVYIKGDSSVNGGATTNIGSTAQNKIVGNGAGLESDTLSQSVQAQQIADPNAPAPANPNATSTASKFQDKSNDIALQNAGLGGADQQQSTGLAAIDKALGGLIGQYDTERAANDANYGTQSDTNRGNLETNKETALVNATQGRRGLFGTLSSLGALSGSGIDLANEAVQKGANEDLTGAEGTFGQNQTGLDTAINSFHAQDDQRRKDAATAADNAKLKVQHDTAVTKQGILSNLANDYSAEGDSANATKYTQMASDLYPTVANNAIPDTTNLTAENAAFTPGSLSNYLNNGATTVSSTPANGSGDMPQLIAQNQNDLKKKAAIATPALVTA
jgi:hypothetical protein